MGVKIVFIGNSLMGDDEIGPRLLLFTLFL